ncbi:MAG: hypothetical protein JWR17_3971 [Pseudomonas sp.]|uniref:hypothetical protein n=1 Tax=Pseudomonas sp. TaxID=306 RepID=UPI00260F9FAB|nr:hypothetical protein [Pseudomonas sp.]MDB6051225.1 hypothetical protein [Pseudomonas sp.]
MPKNDSQGGENMIPDDMALPTLVRQEVESLLDTIKRSSGREGAERAGLRAEGFVLGIERLRALRPADIEALYLVFEQAVELRCGELSAESSV